ncbi:MAG: sigma-70 family RNA polymerase sigma factor [Blastocatellia bacterium]|nr:sigma-70 family RNA polymerase sigma factor [Blastocatellia bacterium]
MSSDLEVLIRRVAEKDQLALDAFYEATSHFVFSLLFKILGDVSVAEEVVVDVYMQVWNSALSYDRARGNPMSWLMLIARSRAIDRFRILKRDSPLKPFEAIEDKIEVRDGPEEDIAIKERQKVVRQALNRLQPEQREVIELAYYYGLSHTEIAERLNQPLGTVKTRMRFAMMRLRNFLSSYSG